jgi:hypothetical protein
VASVAPHVIAQGAVPFVKQLATATADEISAALRPRADDYAAVFLGDLVKLAQEGYASLWESPPERLAKPGQTTIRTSAALASQLTTDNEVSNLFPGGYRRVASRLVPERVWLRWDYREPGAEMGMAYDGLVRLGDRWVWFPKPWRLLDKIAS